MIEALLKLDDLDGDFIGFSYENESFTVVDLSILNDRWAELGRPEHVVVTIRPYFEGSK